MSCGDSLPRVRRKPYPSLACQERAVLLPQLHVCKPCSRGSNAGAESYDDRAQRSLKAKEGRKNIPLGSQGPTLDPTRAEDGRSAWRCPGHRWHARRSEKGRKVTLTQAWSCSLPWVLTHTSGEGAGQATGRALGARGYSNGRWKGAGMAVSQLL